MERSGGGEVKGRRASLQLRLWNLNSTEQSYFRQSGRSGNERECKPTLKTSAKEMTSLLVLSQPTSISHRLFRRDIQIPKT